MPLRNDLNSEVRQILRERWRINPSKGAPSSNDLELNYHGATINATVLYADLDESTKLVDQQRDVFAAQMYKTYLVCAARRPCPKSPPNRRLFGQLTSGRIIARDGMLVTGLVATTPGPPVRYLRQPTTKSVSQTAAATGGVSL